MNRSRGSRRGGYCSGASQRLSRRGGFATALWLLVGVVAALGLWPRVARAQVDVTVLPFHSSLAEPNPGWDEFLVRIVNKGSTAQRGIVQLTPTSSSRDVVNHITVKSEFAVAPGATADVRLPVRLVFEKFGTVMYDFEVKLVNADGKVLATRPVRSSASSSGPVVVDFSDPPRLGHALRSWMLPAPLAVSAWFIKPTSSAGKLVNLAGGGWGTDPITGDPQAPERTIGYSQTALVVATSEQLAKLGAAKFSALAHHVLAGGCLAVAITRPEDLRLDALQTLVGSEIVQGPAPKLLRTVPVTVFSEAPPSAKRSFAKQLEEYVTKKVSLPKQLENKVHGYTGGNLSPTQFGASASYGLGEVHLLGFDPTRPPELESPWVLGRMTELASHCILRDTVSGVRHGKVDVDVTPREGIHSLLDPNRSKTWIVLVAALLLLGYAVLAGPVNFFVARRAHRPLTVLLVLPLLSLFTFSAIVVLGVSARGWRGQARHLTLVEAGAGMGQGVAAHYRGLYTTGSKDLTVASSYPDTVLDVLNPSSVKPSRTVRVDRNGSSLTDLLTTPRDVMILREERFMDLGRGLSVQRDGPRELVLTNRVGRALRSVVVVLPSTGPTVQQEMRFFDRIDDGQTVRTTDAKVLADPFVPPTYYPQLLRAGLSTYLPVAVQKDQPSDLVTAWDAVEQLAPRSMRWWPDDVPVVLALIEGGEGRTHDTGLEVTYDRVLLRVLGYGAAQ